MDSDWITTTEAARLLGVHRTTVACWCRRGQFPGRKVSFGKNDEHWLVERELVLERAGRSIALSPPADLEVWRPANSGNGWLTASQAAEVLGLKKGTVCGYCREGRLAAKKVLGPEGPTWLLEREAVEAEVAERAKAAEMEALGFRWCTSCKEWRPLEDFWKGQHYCRLCLDAKRRRLWKRRGLRDRPNFPGMGNDRLGGGVEDYVAHPLPRDARRYRCMDVGYHHRPVPIGRTKREAFCVNCQARRCYFHPELTPKQWYRRAPKVRAVGT